MITALMLLSACGSSNYEKKDKDQKSIQEELDDRNDNVIPLITRIQRIPGVTLQRGVPVFVKYQNTLSGRSQEPLYVVDGLIIGNSFARIKGIVRPVDVASVRGLSAAEAGFYGARGAQGVIEIKTKSGSEK